MSRHAKNFPDIKVAQLNVHHSPAALNSFLDYCTHKKIDILIISEPPIRKGVPNINKKFSPFYVTPSDNSSRVRSCICILNPSIQPMIISHLSNHDFIAIQIGDIIITSAYATPSYDITPILHRIADVSNYGGGRGLIIAGDFNASHKHWFAKYIDKRGEELLATLLQYNLDTINDCDIPTYDTIRANRRLTSYIDLTIASSTIINHIRNWRVVDDVNMSDHRAIVFDIVNKPNLITVSSTTRWNTTNVDWESWANSIQQGLDDHNLTRSYIDTITAPDDIDYTVACITTCIKSSCDQHFSRYAQCRRRKTPWYNDEELVDLVRQQKSTYRKMRRCFNQSRWISLNNEYQRQRTAYRTRLDILRAAQLKRDIFGQNDQDHYQRVCRMLKGQDILPARTFINCDSPGSTVQNLVDDLFPSDHQETDTPHQAAVRLSIHDWISRHSGINSSYEPVSPIELLNSIQRVKNDKSPGMDNLSPIICKKFIAHHLDIMVAIINCCLRLSYVPYLWKISVVRIIPKPGRESYDKSGSYRPIGLLSILAKVLETIMANRVRKFMQNNCPLSTKQFGFMKKRSTEHALVKLMDNVESNIQNKYHVALVSMDIKGAFNHAWPPGLIKRLIGMNLPEYLIKMITNYNDDRRIVTTFGGVTRVKETNCGTVQGSVLGPLFWNIIVDDLLQRDHGPNVHVQAYADDIVAVVVDKSTNGLAESISSLISVTKSWCDQNKLKLAADKTSVVVMTRKLKPPTIPPIIVDNNAIALSDKMKILGIIVDKKMDYRPHVHYIIDKSTRIFRQILGMARSKYGLGCKVIRQLVQSIIAPILMYGSAVFFGAMKFKSIQDDIRRFQRPIAQLACKSYRTAAFISTTAITDIMPFNLQIIERAYINLAKIRRRYWINNELAVPVDTPDESEIDPGPGPMILTGDATVVPEYHVFTKSTLTNRGIGCCVFILGGQTIIDTLVFRMPTYCSLLQADHFCVLKAIEWIIENWPYQYSVYVINNNLGALAHLMKKDKNNLANMAKDIIRTCPHNVAIIWKKTDRSDNIYRNCKRVAKRAANSNRPFDYSMAPMATVKKKEHCDILAEWDKMYRLNKFGTTIKQICSTVGEARKFAPYANFWLSQTLTGHGQFGAHLKRFGFINDPSCPCGNPNQSVVHMINDCRLANRLRADFNDAKRRATNHDERTRITATFFEQLAMMVDMHRSNLHRQIINDTHD